VARHPRNYVNERLVRSLFSEHADESRVRELIEQMRRGPRQGASAPISDDDILKALAEHQRTHRTARRDACRAVARALDVPVRRVEPLYPQLPADAKGPRGRPKNPTR
jgi:hypothetical protein